MAKAVLHMQSNIAGGCAGTIRACTSPTQPSIRSSTASSRAGGLTFDVLPLVSHCLHRTLLRGWLVRTNRQVGETPIETAACKRWPTTRIIQCGSRQWADAMVHACLQRFEWGECLLGLHSHVPLISCHTRVVGWRGAGLRRSREVNPDVLSGCLERKPRKPECRERGCWKNVVGEGVVVHSCELLLVCCDFTSW